MSAPDRLMARPSARWAVGALLAAMLHAGAAGAMLAAFAPPVFNESDDLAGAVLVELDAAPVEQAAEARETPAAETAEDRQATPDLAETLSARREDDLPVEQSAPDKPKEDDLHFAQEKTEKQKDEPTENEQATEAMTPQTPQQASVAATAAPEAPEQGEREEETRARDLGTRAEAERRALEAWQRALVTQLARNRRYPAEARARHQEGEALVRFRIDRDGKIVSSALVAASRHAALNEEALAMLTRGGALPPPPAHVQGAGLDVTLPVRFRLKGG